MNSWKHIKALCLWIIFTYISLALLAAQPPRLTIAIIVDQGAQHHFLRLAPYWNYGFKRLLTNGVVYTNAYHPHGAPVTATGHATISTGATADRHGVVLNGWVDEDGNSIDFGDDDAQHAAVFGKDTMYDYGLSAKELLVDTLSDQIALNARDMNVLTIAAKPRAAIALAGKLGKAIWFDAQAKQYTSSTAYFKQLPPWLVKFNKKNNIAATKSVTWKLRYPSTHQAYQLPGINNTQYFSSQQRLANTTIKLNAEIKNLSNGDRDDKFLYTLTPAANDNLFDLCKTCINEHLQQPNDRLFLWVSVSNLDMLGHLYGPHSLEVVDLLYHLDYQLGKFMDFANKTVGKENVLFVVTADHGVCPIPELIKEEGYTAAKRIQSKNLIQEMNALAQEKYGIEEIIASFKNSQFFFDKETWNALDAKKQQAVAQTLKTYLLRQPGMKKCWTHEEMKQAHFGEYQLEQWYKNQFHPQRSGDLICMPQPYTILIKYPRGTGHMAPYDYDTHVPLILYQAENIEKRKIVPRVFITQLAPTLAKIIEVPRPTASTQYLLPGIFENY